MAKKILNSKLLYAFLAVVIAIGLWVYVIIVENPSGTESFTVPITFLNESVLEENGLTISSGRNQTVTLTVTGPKSALANLQQAKDNIAVTIDVGKITTPGAQRMGYDYTLPAGLISNVRVTNKYPSNIDFTVSRYIKKEIPVVGSFEGTLAEGYLVDESEFTILPEMIEISGIESDVDQVDHALVTVEGKELSATFEGELGFTLIDSQGGQLSDLNVQCSVDTVSVIMPVLKTAEVPLAVKLVPGGGITSENIEKYVKCEIEPETITVSGKEEDLKPLNEIFLGEVKLANITGSKTFEFDIPLDSALENISGVTKATVSITISGLETKVLEADRIDVITPDGVAAESVTQSLQVLVRGTAEALDLVFDYNLRVVADLSEREVSAGRQTVPVEVYLDTTSDVGVVGSDYKIVVDISG